jgi:hypothetical protein
MIVVPALKSKVIFGTIAVRKTYGRHRWKAVNVAPFVILSEDFLEHRELHPGDLLHVHGVQLAPEAAWPVSLLGALNGNFDLEPLSVP